MDVSNIEAEVRERASRRVAERLKLAEDLQSLDQYRRETVRKSASSQARLKQTLQGQLEDVKRGLELLARAKADTTGIHDDIQEAEDVYAACSALADHVAAAGRISQERNELKVTMEQLDRVFGVPETVTAIKELLEDGGPRPDLLEVHSLMTGLQEARAHLMAQLAAQTQKKRGSAAAVKTYFKGLAECEELLVTALDTGHDPIELAQADPEYLVSILRIIEREDQREQEVCTASATTRGAAAAAAATTPSSFGGGTAGSAAAAANARPKVLVGLKKRYYAGVESTIKARFETRLGGCGSVDAFLRGVEGFYFQDLLVAKDVLPRCFPPGEEIFTFFFSQYHSRLCLMTEHMQGSEDIDPSEIMMLLNWVPVYNNEIGVRLGVEATDLGQQLLGCGEDELRGHYLRIISKKLGDWCGNLVRIEAERWQEEVNEEEPEEEPQPPSSVDGMYLTDAPVILFQMIDQQVNVAFQPGGGVDFADRLLRQCFTTLKSFHAEYVARLLVVQRVVRAGQEQAPMLPELMMAATNNNAQARKYMAQVQAKIEEHIGEDDEVRLKAISAETRQISQGFHRVALLSCGILVDIVFADLTDIISQLFVQKWMRSGKALETVFATLNDYGGDFEEHMSRAYYEHVMMRCQNELLVAYVQAMLKRKINIRTEDDRESLISRLEEETNLIRRSFERYGVGEDEEGRDPALVLVYIRQLMEANSAMIAVGWQKLRVEYPDVTLHHLEAILTVREDFSTKEARQYVRQLVKKEGREREQDDGEGDGAGEDDQIKVISRENAFFGRITVNTSANYSKGAKDDKE